MRRALAAATLAAVMTLGLVVEAAAPAAHASPPDPEPAHEHHFEPVPTEHVVEVAEFGAEPAAEEGESDAAAPVAPDAVEEPENPDHAPEAGAETPDVNADLESPTQRADVAVPVDEARSADRDITAADRRMPSIPAGVTRANASNRAALAASLARSYSPGVTTAYIADVTQWHLMPTGVAAAGAQGAPILHAAGSTVPWQTRQELLRLRPGNIVILAPTNVLTASVEGQLRPYAPQISRVDSGNRFTASRMLVEREYETAGRVMMVSGWAEWQIAGAAAAAGSERMPLLAVDGRQAQLPAATMALLRRLGTVQVTAVGTEGAIHAGLLSQLRGAGISVELVSGINSSAVTGNAARTFHATSRAAVYVSERSPSYALLGAAYAGGIQAPLFTTARMHCLWESQRPIATSMRATSNVLVGARNIVGNSIPNLQPCPTGASGWNIYGGQALLPGSKLVSHNRRHSVYMHADGRFSVYHHGKLRLRASSTAYKGAFARLSSDGRLQVIYDDQVVWQVGSARSDVSSVRLFNDGDLVLRSRSGSSVWSLTTAPETAYRRNISRPPTIWQQRDPRWANTWIGYYRVGPSACRPFALTMALNGMGVSAHPLDVARIANRYGDYNRDGHGSGGGTLRAVTDHYGVAVTSLRSAQDVKRQLQNNRPVLASVRGPSSIVSGGTHAVLLVGYSNGLTTVYDPERSSTYRMSVDVLWQNQSWVPRDRSFGDAAFWALG